MLYTCIGKVIVSQRKRGDVLFYSSSLFSEQIDVCRILVDRVSNQDSKKNVLVRFNARTKIQTPTVIRFS
jgi:hypothetical protein